eukprot:TRINITY_DN1_c0_g2_i1.p1 TRINITY_DN1_c0_g2~~TRINITY_DN1_c0_g2_i1.p1  ORF type:complete len:1043 (+),score=314.55 TRINITY_DN1_c0_g2_i1:117-3131(+)
MSLRTLGLCGIDDSVDPSLLSALAHRFPRAEFGILFREDKEGTPRYPSQGWVDRAASVEPPLRLAAHLCGRRCQQLLEGDTSWVLSRLMPLGIRRIQLNATKINGVDLGCVDRPADRLKAAVISLPEVSWILQANKETEQLWGPFVAAERPPPNVHILYDASCGQGIAATTYPTPPSNGLFTGYAGGIGPENIGEVLKQVRAGAAKDHFIWLDMESKLRSVVGGVEVFDVTKAWACCQAVEGLGWDDPDATYAAPCLLPPPPNASVSGHPVLAHKVTLLRDRSVPPRDFRLLLHEITFYLGYEATTALRTVPRHDVVTPTFACPPPEQARRLCEHVALVPVLRAGLGMVDAMQRLIPNAVVHHLGMFRVKGSSRPVEYYSRLPKDNACHVAFVLDPIIATAATIVSAVKKLKTWGAGSIYVICVLGSREGLQRLHAAHPDVRVYCAQVDEHVNSAGWVVPGLGDAGDRQFGTPATAPPDGEGLAASLSPRRGSFMADKEGGWVVPPPVRSPQARHAPLPGQVSPPPQHSPTGMRPVTTVLGPIVDDVDPATLPEPEADDQTVTALTTHDGAFGPAPVQMRWGAPTPGQRGPVLATTRHPTQRNAIGAHSGGYSIYRALAVVSGGLDTSYVPRLGMTTPVARIGPFPAWHDPLRIVTLDPYGHAISEGFGAWLQKGFDVRPTIAVTKAHIELPECKEALRVGRLKSDGAVLLEDGQSFVTKAAIEPVWHLPGVALRFGVEEHVLRDALFKETNSMYPELITRPDLKLFLPPIGGMTVYIWGDPEQIPDESVELTVRVHDECNGSDVFGSDICTCRPYLTHAIEECIKTAQRGGTGVVVYFRKEGRALGEVTKYLVYNMRKRQEGGDRAEEYFNCTQTVAGVTDTRFQALMPDVLHWLGVTRIHRFISMSDMKYDAIVKSGIRIDERVEIPPEMVPKDAQVEITAKVYCGYHGGTAYGKVDQERLRAVKGREYSKELDYKQSVKEGGGAQGTAGEDGGAAAGCGSG